MASYRRLQNIGPATRSRRRHVRGLPMPAPIATARFLLPLFLLFGLARTSPAVTRDSPEVLKLVESGLEYLDENTDERLGGRCLIALAVLKSSRNDVERQARLNHRRIREAIAACRDALRIQPPITDKEYDVYSNGLAIIFLCELDPQQYRREIDGFFRALYARQKAHGGWGYDTHETGDTSQTQYGLLSCWEAHHAGIPVSSDAVLRALNWLLKTQDPNGAWGYQGQLPENNQLRRQEGVTVSMLAAGLGGVLMCSHMLGIEDLRTTADSEQGLDLPPAFIAVGDQKEAPPVAGASQVNRKRLTESIRMANEWMERNYTIHVHQYNCYYLYSIERYRSFQEKLLGEFEEEPKWYNDGFEFLNKNQKDDGHWSANCGQAVDTAFSILFLIRSMQLSLQGGIGGGTLISGRGFPRNTDDVKLQRGRLMIDDTRKKINELLKVLEDPSHPDYERLMTDPQSITVDMGEVRPEDVDRLRQTIRGGEPAIRRIAVRSLARRRNLDDVPTLLYAMTDPDRQVVLAARDGLRFISRRFEGFGLADDYTDRARFDAIEKWKRWYLSIRPDAILD